MKGRKEKEGKKEGGSSHRPGGGAAHERLTQTQAHTEVAEDKDERGAVEALPAVEVLPAGPFLGPVGAGGSRRRAQSSRGRGSGRSLLRRRRGGARGAGGEGDVRGGGRQRPRRLAPGGGGTSRKKSPFCFLFPHVLTQTPLFSLQFPMMAAPSAGQHCGHPGGVCAMMCCCHHPIFS